MSKYNTIRVTNDKVFLSKEVYVPLAKTNFPEQSLMFKTHIDIIWDVVIKKYDVGESLIVLEVENYYSNNNDPYIDLSLYNKVLKVDFIDLIWEELEKFLSSYKKVDLIRLLAKKEDAHPGASHPKSKYALSYSKDYFDIPDESEIEVFDKYEEHFEYPFRKVEFKNGTIQISKKFSFHNKPIDIFVANEYSLEQFNIIKSYFARVLNVKKINIHGKFEILDNDARCVSAKSTELDKINPELVDEVKNRILSTIPFMKHDGNTQKSVLDVDELIDSIDAIPKGFLNPDIDTIINILLEKGSIKNEKQIKFLVNFQPLNKSKLRFTLNPLFGFLIFIEGFKSDFYCWELLNSHATYIWSSNKDQNYDFSNTKIEESISLIREIGRAKYKSLLKSQPGLYSSKFIVLNHRGKEDNPRERFNLWKAKVEKIILS